MPEHNKPLIKKIRGFVQSENTVPVWSQRIRRNLAVEIDLETHGLAQKCTYQPTLAYFRRLP